MKKLTLKVAAFAAPVALLVSGVNAQSSAVLGATTTTGTTSTGGSVLGALTNTGDNLVAMIVMGVSILAIVAIVVVSRKFASK
jgi:hypothetical protein